jgi:hypothetical protein
MSPSSAATPVTLVVMRGNFVDTMAKEPASAAAPAGHTMAFILDRATGRVAALYVGEARPSVSTLGPVEAFSTSTSTSSVSSARRARKLPRLLARSRHHHRARAARWGLLNRCGAESAPTNRHCYDLAEWEGTQLEATQELQKTTTMEVPGSEYGYFVDMEEWTSLGSAGGWFETGQQGGEYKGCCSLWWFYAGSFGPKEYFQYVDAPYVWEVSANQYNEYAMKSVNPSTPNWCIYIAPNFETKYACFSSSKWSVYSTGLEAGAEVATEEKPSFAGSQEVNYQALSGYYYGWGSSTTYSHSTPGLCHTYVGPTPGDMNYGTC